MTKKDRYQKIISADRKKIDKITVELIRLIRRRARLTYEIGMAKRHLGLKVTDRNREAKLFADARRIAKRIGVDQNLVIGMLRLLVKHARKNEKNKNS